MRTIAALLMLVLVPLCLAVPDLTNSGSVDMQDLLLVLDNLGREDFNPVADVNEDGIVDLFDLVLVARAFGQQTPPSEWEGSGDPLYPNQPEGWVIWREQEWHSLQDNTGITWAAALERNGEFRLGIPDPTAPDGSGVVAEVFFPQGMPDGSTPGRVATHAPAHREVFIGDYVKFSEDFSWHTLGIKMLLFGLPGGGWVTMGGGGYGFSEMHEYPPPQMGIGSRTGGTIQSPIPLIRDEIFPYNVNPPPPYERGEWMRREYYFRMNTPGDPNGIARMWIDGVLVTDIEGIDFGRDQIGWGQIQYGMTWGGGGSAVPHDQTIRIAHLRVLTPE